MSNFNEKEHTHPLLPTTTTTPHSPSPTHWHRLTAILLPSTTTLKATSLILTNILVITVVATQLCILGVTLWAGGLVFEVIKALFVTCVYPSSHTSHFPLPHPLPNRRPCGAQRLTRIVPAWSRTQSIPWRFRGSSARC